MMFFKKKVESDRMPKRNWNPEWSRSAWWNECGNKRCPKATDHTLGCTRSNEPGQEGSIYG